MINRSPIKQPEIKKPAGEHSNSDFEDRNRNDFLSNSQRKPRLDYTDTFKDLKLEKELTLPTKLIFVQVLESIHKESKKHTGALRAFLMNYEHQQKNPSIREFNAFLKSLEISDAMSLALVGILDYKQRGYVLNSHFLGSYNSFKALQDEIRAKYARSLQELKQALNIRNLKSRDLEKLLSEKSEFGYMKRQKFVEFLKELNFGLSVGTISKLADYLDFK